MELQNEEVGHGLNIPGSMVGGDYTCKEMIRMNVFMGDICLYMPRSHLANNGKVMAFLHHLAVCYNSLPLKGKGGCNYGKLGWKKMNFLLVFCLCSPVLLNADNSHLDL